jgi:hypothetical protein
MMKPNIPIKEITADCKFRSRTFFKDHFVSHIENEPENDELWDRLIGTDLMDAFFADPENPEIRERLGRAYEQLASDEVQMLCRIGRQHIHVVRVGDGEPGPHFLAFNSVRQEVRAWSARIKMLIFAAAPVQNGEVGEYFLRSMYPKWHKIGVYEARRLINSAYLMSYFLKGDTLLANHLGNVTAAIR